MPNYNRVIKNRIQKEDLDDDAGCLFLKKKNLHFYQTMSFENVKRIELILI